MSGTRKNDAKCAALEAEFNTLSDKLKRRGTPGVHYLCGLHDDIIAQLNDNAASNVEALETAVRVHVGESLREERVGKNNVIEFGKLRDLHEEIVECITGKPRKAGGKRRRTGGKRTKRTKRNRRITRRR